MMKFLLFTTLVFLSINIQALEPACLEKLESPAKTYLVNHPFNEDGGNSITTSFALIIRERGVEPEPEILKFAGEELVSEILRELSEKKINDPTLDSTIFVLDQNNRAVIGKAVLNFLVNDIDHLCHSEDGEVLSTEKWEAKILAYAKNATKGEDFHVINRNQSVIKNNDNPQKKMKNSQDSEVKEN